MHLSIILALEPELKCLGSRDVESYLPRCFYEPAIGFLWKGIKGIVCGDDNGCSYARNGVTLDLAIVEQTSLRRLSTITLVECVMYIFR